MRKFAIYKPADVRSGKIVCKYRFKWSFIRDVLSNGGRGVRTNVDDLERVEGRGVGHKGGATNLKVGGQYCKQTKN